MKTAGAVFINIVERMPKAMQADCFPACVEGFPMSNCSMNNSSAAARRHSPSQP